MGEASSIPLSAPFSLPPSINSWPLSLETCSQFWTSQTNVCAPHQSVMMGIHNSCTGDFNSRFGWGVKGWLSNDLTESVRHTQKFEHNLSARSNFIPELTTLPNLREPKRTAVHQGRSFRLSKRIVQRARQQQCTYSSYHCATCINMVSTINFTMGAFLPWLKEATEKGGGGWRKTLVPNSGLTHMLSPHTCSHANRNTYTHAHHIYKCFKI